jgi:hypothetical protein
VRDTAFGVFQPLGVGVVFCREFRSLLCAFYMFPYACLLLESFRLPHCSRGVAQLGIESGNGAHAVPFSLPEGLS